MKKLGLLVAGLITVFSMAFAQGNYFGVFSGYPEAIGVQYTMNDNLRLSIGLPMFGGSGITDSGITNSTIAGAGNAGSAVVGSVDMIMARGSFSTESDMSWYYGAGVSVLYSIYPLYIYNTNLDKVNINVFGASGHGLLGVEWLLPDSNLGLFSEAQLGLGFRSYSALGRSLAKMVPAFSVRVGVNFH